MNSKLAVKPISTIREQFESKGGCFKCPLNYGRFEVLWISKPTFDGSNTILKSSDSKGYWHHFHITLRC